MAEAQRRMQRVTDLAHGGASRNANSKTRKKRSLSNSSTSDLREADCAYIMGEGVLLRREALVLQASPVASVEKQLDKVSDAFQSELASNAMLSLVLLAVGRSGFA